MAKDMYQKRKERQEAKVNNDKNLHKTSINWYPGHMEKAKRDIKEKLSLIDIVVEVVDSRIPISSKIVDLDELIQNKPRILVMTKYDLCDKSRTDRIIKYYEDNGYIVIPVNLKENKCSKLIINRVNLLMKDINDKRKAKGMKPRPARALVVGVPNVGKSTLINSLVGRKAAPVGDKPGITKTTSWIRIGDIELLDTPGILWPKLENQEGAYKLAICAAIKEDILNKKDLATYIINILSNEYPESIRTRYGIEINTSSDMIEDIAKARKCVLKGNELDLDRVYSIIINDFNDNKFGLVTFDKIV